MQQEADQRVQEGEGHDSGACARLTGRNKTSWRADGYGVTAQVPPEGLVTRCKMVGMFTRVDRGRVPAQKLDEFVSFMRDEVVPELRKVPGYLSTSVEIVRGSGVVSVSTDWDTFENRERCDEVLATVLKNASRLELRPIQIELYELVLVDP